jgi:hypothetical protein
MRKGRELGGHGNFHGGPRKGYGTRNDTESSWDHTAYLVDDGWNGYDLLEFIPCHSVPILRHSALPSFLVGDAYHCSMELPVNGYKD